MKAIQVTKTNETKLDFKKNKQRVIDEIKNANLAYRIMVLEITEDSFYVVFGSSTDVNWVRYSLNFHYVNSVEIIDIEW